MGQINPQMPQIQQMPQAQRKQRAVPASEAGAMTEQETEIKKEAPLGQQLQMAGPQMTIQTLPNITKKDVGKTNEDEEVDETDDIDEEEQEILLELGKNIKQTSKRIAKGVNKSAFKHMLGKGWLSENAGEDAEEFFTIKIPRVLARKLSVELYEQLGITDFLDSDEDK